MKFGGALLNSASNIERVAGLIEEFSCEPLVVVVSALGKTTNALEHLFCFRRMAPIWTLTFLKLSNIILVQHRV